MASVFKRQGQPNWYARFMIKGKDYCISTGTPNRKEAIAFMKKRVAMLKGDASLEYHFDELQQLIDTLPNGDQEKTRREFARRLMGASIAKLKIADA